MAFTVSMKIVDAFFDRPAVLDRMDRATARSLPKAGAFVRRRAISRDVGRAAGSATRMAIRANCAVC